MKNLTNAIYSLFTATTGGVHNAFYTDIGGRLYKNKADQDAPLPYAVYFLVSDTPEFTFTDTFEDVLIQFNLHSESSSSSNIEDMYTHLKALYDWCSLTITDNTHLFMRRESANLITDEDGDWQYSVTYRIMMEPT